MSGQLPLFEVDFSFLKIHHDMVRSGRLAKLGPIPFAVLVALRSHVSYSGTSAFPSQATLAEECGISLSSVKKGLRVLVQENYLLVRSTSAGKRKKNIYSLNENLTATDVTGETDYVLTIPYGPEALQAARKDIEQFQWTGSLPPGSPVQARPINLVIQVNYGDGGTNININAEGSPAGQHDIQEQLAELGDPALRDQISRTYKAALGALTSPPEGDE